MGHATTSFLYNFFLHTVVSSLNTITVHKTKMLHKYNMDSKIWRFYFPIYCNLFINFFFKNLICFKKICSLWFTKRVADFKKNIFFYIQCIWFQSIDNIMLFVCVKFIIWLFPNIIICYWYKLLLYFVYDTFSLMILIRFCWTFDILRFDHNMVH